MGSDKGEKSVECRMSGISVHYETAGTGRPVLMIHGYTVDHRLMSGCMEPVFKSRDGYRRIYVDLPGMGQTRGEKWITNSDRMLDVLLQFIERTIPDQNFLLAGESYGGYMARGLVHRMADRVDGLLLLCPAIIMDLARRDIPPHVVLERDDELMSQLAPSDAGEFSSVHVVQNAEIWRRFRDEILCGLKAANYDFLTGLRERGYGFSFDVDTPDHRFDKPTLMLLGRQDSSVGYKDAWSILENYPRATFAVLDKAGHNLQIEQPELFESLVGEWLGRVEGGR